MDDALLVLAVRAYTGRGDDHSIGFVTGLLGVLGFIALGAVVVLVCLVAARSQRARSAGKSRENGGDG